MEKCPMCGYQEVKQGQRVHTIMNEYINARDPKKVICVNNDVDKFETKDEDGNVKQVWILKSVYEKSLQQSSTIEGAVDVVHPSTEVVAKKVEPTIVNHLVELPPATELTSKPVVELKPEVTKDLVPNPFASVKAPIPNGGPI